MAPSDVGHLHGCQIGPDLPSNLATMANGRGRADSACAVSMAPGTPQTFIFFEDGEKTLIIVRIQSVMVNVVL